MEVKYKGFKIEAEKDNNLGGDKIISYAVIRMVDLLVFDEGYSYETSVRKAVKSLKDDIDEWVESGRAFAEDIDEWDGENS